MLLSRFRRAFFPALIFSLYLLTFFVFYQAYNQPPDASESLSGLRLLVLILLLPVLVKYVIQLLLLPCYTRLSRPKNSPIYRQNLAKVSLLIPAYNEEVGILKTIHSALNSDYDAVEVIVINDGSTDQTHELIAAFLTTFKQTESKSLKYLKLENGGKAKALNQGLQLAGGEIIITVDADSIIDPQAVRRFVAAFANPKVGAAAGNVIVGNKTSRLAWLQQLEYLYGFFFKRSDSVLGSVYIIGGASAAYRRQVLDQVGGFDHEIITEDIEMSTRILAHGHATQFVADAVVFTEAPETIKGLSNQRLRWKYGRLLTFIKHRDLFFSLNKRHNPYLTLLVLPLAVYSELLLLLEPLLLCVFFGYTLQSGDFLPMALVAFFTTTLLAIQIAVDSKRSFHRNLLPLLPIAWLLFYWGDFIEGTAIFRSLKRLAKKEELRWQKWIRVGLTTDSSYIKVNPGRPHQSDYFSAVTETPS